MRILRQFLINLYSVLGIISIFLFLALITGFLLGILTPQKITSFLAISANGIIASAAQWWSGILLGWIASTSAIYFLWITGSHPPVKITEDDFGAVEISTQALCSLAKEELRNQGITVPCKTDFTRKLGTPVLQVWCDLVARGNGENPVDLGERLKHGIEQRLREDFNLKGIRVSIIHQPLASNAG
jgi:hypothetical protein